MNFWISDWRVLKAGWPDRGTTYHFYGNCGVFSGGHFSGPIVQFSHAAGKGKSELNANSTPPQGSIKWLIIKNRITKV